MRTATRLASLIALAAAPFAAAPFAAVPFAVAPLAAQDARVFTLPRSERTLVAFDDRPMIGVTTAGDSERADTLGLRITDVTDESPAAKAGLKAGDRLQSVNGVSLRADRADAGEEDYSGVLNRRLQREVQRTKEGESVELRVLSDGQSRTVRVTPVPGRELARATMRTREGDEATLFRRMSDRAVLGLTVAATGTVRDTAGVFVQRVDRDGPAEKAGIIEGDRIAAINGVSLKVSREDVEDRAVAATRAERLARELAKLKVGDAAELTVVTGGRTRTVRVTTVAASELRDGEWSAFEFGAPGGMIRVMPDGGTRMMLPRGEMPEVRMRRFDDGELRRRLEEIAPRLREMTRRRVITTDI